MLLNPKTALDPSKMRRMFKKYGKLESQKSSKNGRGMECLMFDGRKDKTMAKTPLQNDDQGSNVRQTITEEHVVIIEEPGSVYREHLNPASGRSLDISNDLYQFIVQHHSQKSLRAIGADGTAVNTGKNTGIIRRLELLLKRPLQWIICLYHLNELPFRHLFRYYDGATTGPSSYKGEIGRKISEDLRKIPAGHFSRIAGKIKVLKKEVADELSTDQKYLYEMGIAIQKGAPLCSKLELRDPGRLCESRWLTKANRILRLYVGTKKPSFALKRLV